LSPNAHRDRFEGVIAEPAAFSVLRWRGFRRKIEVAGTSGQGDDSMEKRLFVGNLPFSMGEQDLESSFANHGTVVSAVIIRDRDTGQSRGFGFVEMETEAMAEEARGALDGLEVDGRRIRVNSAQAPRRHERRSDIGERW
jgi:RNA recognition motif-containing protein